MMHRQFHPEPAVGGAGTEIETLIAEMTRKARAASRRMATCPTATKNAALRAMAAAFRTNVSQIQTENTKDLEAAEANGLTPAMIDRLRLTDARIEGMAVALEEIAELPDPVGEINDLRQRPCGVKIGQMRVPIGVIGIIYESRPNVTADAGALCIKSGNAVILRGGKEAIHSNRAIAQLMEQAAAETGLPEGALQLVPTTDRAAVSALLTRDGEVDVIIPRGGKGLIRAVMDTATIPVIKHLDGNCFVYIDKDSDFEKALPIAINSKTQRTGVCNAAETLLIHRDVLETQGVAVVKALVEKGVEVRADAMLCGMVDGLKHATDEDWDEEYLDMIIAAHVVESADEAIDFINAHSSSHTEAIVTENYQTAMQFLNGVDSACVFVNASTRFSDGGEFGMGAEIGISTDKLHARGPMGVRELTTQKFIALGEGQIRE